MAPPCTVAALSWYLVVIKRQVVKSSGVVVSGSYVMSRVRVRVMLEIDGVLGS